MFRLDSFPGLFVVNLRYYSVKNGFIDCGCSRIITEYMESIFDVVGTTVRDMEKKTNTVC